MPNWTTTPTAGSPSVTLGSPASPPLDPYLRAYFETRWRACITELRMIAPILGWSDRLPSKGN